MTILELRNVLIKSYNDVTFMIKGVSCGIASEVHDSVPKFQAWYGDLTREYDNVDTLLFDDFFGGQSLINVSSKLEFTIM